MVKNLPNPDVYKVVLLIIDIQQKILYIKATILLVENENYQKGRTSEKLRQVSLIRKTPSIAQCL